MQPTPVSQNQPHAGTSTALSAAALNANIPTAVSIVRPIIPLETAPGKAGLNPLIKSHPWTPIRLFILERVLISYPDKAFVEQLINDLQHGCAIGYNRPQFANFANNLPSAYQQPEVIDATLKKECEAGQILGPFPIPPLNSFHTSVLGLVPNHDGGWHIIYHLSTPVGININDFIDSSTYSLSYCFVDDAYTFVNQLGPGTLLSKIDLKDTLQLIPVHPTEWNLLRIHWKQQFI